MAYKRELIVNNGSLTSYKKLLKVSDVCQLLDKREYVGTSTSNGITYTNNGDGTITINGTATAWSAYVTSLKFDMFLGHKYLLYPSPTDVNVSLQCGLRNAAGVWLVQWLCNSPTVYTLTNENVATGQFWIGVQKGKTVSNVTVSPQAFDLTEMYGAGNEPTTVAEFKAKFPNELYDYSPRCWVKSYKTGLIAQTKNLFNDIPVKTNTVISESGVEESALGYNVYSKIYGNNFTISANAPIDLTEMDNWLRVCLYNSSGAFIARRDFDFSRETVVHIVDNTMSYMQLCVSSYTFPDYKLQVEKGTTATDYVPYGYL